MPCSVNKVVSLMMPVKRGTFARKQERVSLEHPFRYEYSSIFRQGYTGMIKRFYHPHPLPSHLHCMPSHLNFVNNVRVIINYNLIETFSGPHNLEICNNLHSQRVDVSVSDMCAL